MTPSTQVASPASPNPESLSAAWSQARFLGALAHPIAQPRLAAIVLAVLVSALLCPAIQAATASARIDGNTTYQTIDGFGVNINDRSWNGSELKPVLDAFIDQAGMTSFRVVYELSDWETTNDNADPASINWTYYNSVYSGTSFQRLWDLFGYLNSRGLSDGAFINFMGWGPAWMMDSDGRSLKPGMEAEWAEMITSALAYARNTRGLNFRLVAPNNEPDLYNEGVHVSAATYANALHQLALRLDANGLGDVGIVGPDAGAGGTAFLPEMLADPVVMAKLRRVGVHSYASGGGGSAGVYDYIRSSAYPDRNVWLTEFNVWCSTCDGGTRGTYDWAYTKGTAAYLLGHLLNNVSAAFAWEGYDSIYAHHGNVWSYWGLFAVDDINAAVKTYTPRKNFYTVSQISKFIRPGAQRVAVSGATGSLSPLLAFKHTGMGQVTIVGINTAGTTTTFTGTLASLPAVSSLDLYYTSATVNLARMGTVAVSNGTFTVTLPADCVFTLTGGAGVSVAVTGPVNGARFNAPASIPITATATSTGGAIDEVSFYNGSTLLNAVANPPYQYVWNGVPMGSYSISAAASDTAGNLGVSAGINVAVVGALARIVVSPSPVTLAPGAIQQFTAVGSDQLGQLVDASTVYSWSVNGGGVVDTAGRFTAGASAGGPFTVTASSGGVTGTAAVTIAASSGTIGNNNDGTLTDNLWSNGAWINATRFQASANMTVSLLYAKVAGIPGHYKCAIYADSSSLPSRLLGTTAAINQPGTGWRPFPLASPVALTAGTNYWLAIWSDDTNGRVYYSGSNGTLRWGAYTYGTWPDPIATSGAGTFNYCIYASGSQAPVAVLASIAVTPASPSVVVGGTQQFTATGTYSDNTTQNLTSLVAWASSATARATIASSGLATAVSPGATTISATSGQISGSTLLTVQPSPLSITTASLPAGVVGTPYSATLAATGGITPYTWSVSLGTLPPGLSVNPATGVIAGTPTSATTASLTLRVADSSSPPLSTTRNLSIAVSTASSAPVTIWPSTARPTQVDGGADSSVELGVKFRSDVPGTVTGLRFYKASTNTGTHSGNLWSSTGALLASATFSGETSSGWQQFSFSRPVTIAANTVYVVSYHCGNGHYSISQNYFATTGFDAAPLHALANGVSGGNGVYRYGAGNQFPAQTWNTSNYWVDVVFVPAAQ